MKTAISALALATVLVAGAANAADLPSQKAPPPYIPPPPVMSWSGFYAGLNVGGGWQDSSSSNVTWWAANNGGGAGGVVGGGQIGYNYQLTPMFVVGLETDFQGTSIGSGGGGNWWTPGGNTARINWFGTVRGRLGVTLFNPNLLVYGTGGFAYGEVQSNFWNGWWNNNASAVQTGWTAGGGAEWMFMPNWSVKVEYLYTEISGGNNNGVNWGVGLNNVNNRTRFHTVRAGVNYHFNLFNSAPVLAKY